MLLGDAHVEVAVRVLAGEAHQAGTLAHRRRDAHHARIDRCHVAQPVSEHLRVTRHRRRDRGGLHDDADARVELRHAVVLDRIGLGRGIALSLARHHVQELQAAQVAQVLQRRGEVIDVVPVHRAQVVEAEFLEQRAGQQHALHMFLGALGQFQHARRGRQYPLAGAPRRGVEAPGHQARQVVVQGTDRRRDRHVVVVQDHQQVAVGRLGVVQGLERKARRHRTIADDGHHPARVIHAPRCHCHAKRSADRGRRMRDAEGVVLALVAAREAGDAAAHAQPVHALAAAGQYLVRIGLVAHVPDQPVIGRVEHIVQRDRQFDRAEVGRQVPPATRHRLQQELAQFIAQLRQVAALERAQVGRTGDAAEQFEDFVRLVQNCLFTMKSASCPSLAARGPSGTSAASACARRSRAHSFAARNPSTVT